MEDNVEGTDAQNAKNSAPPVEQTQKGVPAKRGSAKAIGWFALLIVGIGMVYFGWGLMQERNRSIPTPKVLPPAVDTKPRAGRPEKVAQLYADNVDPLISVMTRKNEEAVRRAIESVQNRFREFQNGIDPFTEDLTSYGTQFGVMGRMIGTQYDKWWKKKENADRVGGYIKEKFRLHVVSEDSLKKAISEVVNQYQIDLAANRNEMESQAKMVLTSLGTDIDFSRATPDWDAFFQDVEDRRTEMLKSMVNETVFARCLIETGGFVAGLASVNLTQIILERVLSQAATQLATRFAAGAATALGSSAAGGATAGTVGGPVGTVIGCGVGLAIGITVDKWMTDKFRDDMKRQVSAYLASLEKEILDGSAVVSASGDNKEPRGIKAILAEINRINDETTRKAMLQTMIERASV